MRCCASLLALLACACAAEPGLSGAELASGAAWVDRAVTIEARGTRTLLAAELAPAQDATDRLPPRAMAILDGDRWIHPPVPVWSGRLTARGVVWVSARGDLLDDAGRVLERAVEPELAVSEDGLRVAWVRSPAEPDEGVHVLDLAQGASVHASAAMAHAGRPIFDGDRLIVVGSGPSGIAGVWTIDLRDGDPPRATAITNGALRTGDPLGDSFTPPPAHHASMRVEDGALVYDDGESTRRVVLPEAPR